MCGIAGFLANQSDQPEAAARLERMLATIAQRGPDDQGVWQEGPVFFGHRRLSVVDLSPAGRQPMMSSNGRYVITFNGEIYNHKALRHDLEMSGARFRGHSDTEVLLMLIEREGLASALAGCVGMFAFAMWDRETQQLHLARDRFGEKPLYYGWSNGSFLFASQLKALVTWPSLDRGINHEAVSDVLRLGYAVAPKSIFRHVHKLPPGSMLSVTCTGAGAGHATPVRYWDARMLSLVGAERRFRGTYEEASEELEAHISDAVALQLQADVSVGTFLSGGIDSSLVTAFAQLHAERPVRTYSIGFLDEGLNEATYAKEVAAHLGTQHTEWYVGEADALTLVPDLSDVYDEPLADASQIPTCILAKLTRRDVTVALSGDGADEIFGGYPKYMRGHRHFNMAAGPLSRGVFRACSRFASLTGALLNSPFEHFIPWHSFRTAHALYSARSKPQLAHELSTLNRSVGLTSQALPFDLDSELELDQAGARLSYRRTAMLLDIVRFLPDDILTKVDRATMAASLESRAPFLDHRIYEFASRLPEGFMFDRNGGKRILRSIAYRHIPRRLLDRPKAGFVAPLGAWLRNPLREWSYDLLSSSAAERVLEPKSWLRLLDLHCRARFDLSARIWPALTLAAWANRWT